MREASQEFLAVLSRGGCLVTDCICGHTYFATNHDGQGHYDENELERLRAKALEEPTKYTEEPDCDTIHVATFQGVNYVVDCPCGRLAKLEQLLWNAKDTLLQYYRLRTDREAQETASADDSLKALGA
jgi:hypothetical protein